MQMYLALPFAYLIAVQRAGWRSILALWAAAAIASAVTTRLFHHLDFLSYVPCFLPGVMAFALYRRARAQRPWTQFPLVLAALTAIYVVTRVEPVAWLGCLALGCAIPFFRDMPAGRLWRACHLIARYSYGVYLTHFILIWVFFVRLAGLPAALRWIGFVAAAAIVPVVLYHLVEEPLIRRGNRLGNAILTSGIAQPAAGALEL
jgi:peptidoglycan/LPS O-acetylase OafA/YrhL